MRLLRPALCMCVTLLLAGRSADAQGNPARRLNPGEPTPPKLLSMPAESGTCTSARFTVRGTTQVDSGVTRTMTIAANGKNVRQIITSETSRGQLMRLTDVSLAALENVELRFEGGRPRVSWHTTEDAGMADSAAIAAAQRVAGELRRRCPPPR